MLFFKDRPDQSLEKLNAGRRVPMIAAMHFPRDPSKTHVLPVDFPLTYDRLASYDFDPQAEYLYAMELMSATR